MIEIPLQSLPWYKFSIDLDEKTYAFEIYWNMRAERWHLDIYDTSGQPLLCGIPLHVHTDLLAYVYNEALPSGGLMLMETSGANVEMTQENVENYKLLYIPYGEVV